MNVIERFSIMLLGRMMRNSETSSNSFVAVPVRCLVIVGLCLCVTTGLQAQTPDPTPLEAPQPGVRPPLSPFPRFQDWSFLRDPSQRVDPYDRLKFIPLNDSETNYLTLGLESRTEFQYLDNNDWGAGRKI